MHPDNYAERLVNLMPADHPPVPQTLRTAVADGDVARLSKTDGHFAIVAKCGKTVRLARTIGRPMRYFLAKRFDGPHLIVAERMDEIRRFAAKNGLLEQFHPTYTRMVPAHFLVEIELTGCPDPSPVYRRFFTPQQNALPADIGLIGRSYMEATEDALRTWLAQQPANEPLGVSFSGGIDSTAILILARRAIEALGRPLENLRAFTLSFGADALDARQATETIRTLGLGEHHEIIAGDPNDLDVLRVIRVVEDYRPIDIQCAAMNMALLAGIRRKYPQWRLMIDGDGGDENLKDYPLEGTDITTQSVLNNPVLYHEGWGVDSIKHSSVYSGGLSRSYARTYMPLRHFGFRGFSPFTVPSVIGVSEAIPFAELTRYEADRLYALKGQVVSAGIQQVCGVEMPVQDKRRFQEGVLCPRELEERLPIDKPRYRRTFDQLWDLPTRESRVTLPA